MDCQCIVLQLCLFWEYWAPVGGWLGELSGTSGCLLTVGERERDDRRLVSSHFLPRKIFRCYFSMGLQSGWERRLLMQGPPSPVLGE
ncbi:NSIG domain-containing protein [Histoplasma capsulatum var. duboisii H88]|uniref:NSIG domain-containing protein n=1 Tax=Ajellomyces capsulatus (strain H88) TaxID=544711 RepID=A0A8A1LWD8_AJEC8|nr:NSIG domain-containing protein [Histoplasma capsulatum var. duboisii H88]